MEDLIRSILSAAVTSLGGLIDKVRGLLLALWGTLLSTFDRWRSEFGALGNAAGFFFGAVGRFGYWFLVINDWLIRIFIPGFSAAATVNITQWVLSRLADAARATALALDAVRTLARAIVAALRTEVLGWVNFLRDSIASAWATLLTTARRVSDLLFDPAALAEWAIDAIFHAFLKYAQRSGQRFGGWLLGQGVRATLASASIVEGVIARVIG